MNIQGAGNPAVRENRDPVVWVVGDVAVDLTMKVLSFPRPGGDAFAESLTMALGGCGTNIAITLTRLGIKTVLIAGVGCDTHGREALSALTEAGIDTSAITCEAKKQTHITVIVVTPDGERTILGYAGASRQVKGDIVSTPLKESPAAIVVSGYALLDSARRRVVQGMIERSSPQQTLVFLDIPVALSKVARHYLKQVLSSIDTLVVGAQEAYELSGSNDRCEAATLLSGEEQAVIVTHGSDSLFYSRAGEVLTMAPPRAKVLDSTGAGDAFIAALVAARLRGFSVTESLATACLFGAASTQVIGAGASLPGPKEALTFLAESEGSGAAMSTESTEWLRGP